MGAHAPLRPKRARRGRSRPRRSPLTTSALRRPARQCVRRRCAARGSTSCSSGCPPSSRQPSGSSPTAGWSVRPESRKRRYGAKSSIRCAAFFRIERFTALFGEGRSGRRRWPRHLPDGRVIAGTVDRLLVEERPDLGDRFQDRTGAASDADIPNAHHAQMQAYAEALRVIFPGREVRAALLYTAGPKLIEVMP